MTIRDENRQNDRSLEAYDDTVLEVKNARRMGQAGLYFQLMEECAELTQACAKVLRLSGYGQPVGKEDRSFLETRFRDNLIEEIADVSLVIDEVLIIESFLSGEDTGRVNGNDAYCICRSLHKRIAKIQSEKLKRTAERYEEADKNEQP